MVTGKGAGWSLLSDGDIGEKLGAKNMMNQETYIHCRNCGLGPKAKAIP